MTEKQFQDQYLKLLELEKQQTEIETAIRAVRETLQSDDGKLLLPAEVPKHLPRGITVRKDGRYMARFMHCGKSYVLYGRDPEKLQVSIEELRYKVKHGLNEKEENITADKWFHIWMEEYKYKQVKATTCKVYETVYSVHIKPHIGNRKLKEIQPLHLQQVLNEESEKNGRQTLSGIYIVMNMMFKQAYKNGMIRQNPAERTTLPHLPENDERRVMTKEEQQIFLQYTGNAKYGKLFELALSTGLRSGEMRALEWQDIDFTNKTIHVRGTLSYLRGKYYKSSPKSRTSKRDVPMMKNVCRILLEQKKAQQESRERTDSVWQPLPGLENLVFTKETGRPLPANSLLYYIKRLQDAIREDFPDWVPIHPHTLRHTFATRAIEGGMEPQTLKTILGHSSLSMTMDLYSHVLPDTKAAQMQKIEGMF